MSPRKIGPCCQFPPEDTRMPAPSGCTPNGLPDLTPHPDTDRIAKRLAGCLPNPIAWLGTVCRSSSLRYANATDIVTGEGALKAGGRFNSRRSFPVLYNSVEPETAVAEAWAARRR